MARTILVLLVLFVSFSANSQNIFIVRHAEKAAPGPDMKSDVSLSETGNQRAEALKEALQNEQIQAIYSTNTLRTRSTAAPTASLFGLNIQSYGPYPDSAFAKSMIQLGKNVLIVGHSNTVDDLVNLIMGEKVIPGDLDESEYDNLYVIRFTNGVAKFEHRKYGAASAR